MKNIDYELIEWAKERIQKKYPEDVALLIGMYSAGKTPEDTQKTSQKALEYLNTTMEIFATMQFEEKLYKIRKAAGGISSFLVHAIALTNGSYIVNSYGNIPLDIFYEDDGKMRSSCCFF